MKYLILSLTFLLVQGCASSPLGRVADGGAIYRYEKNPDGGCIVEITSAREVSGGSIEIGSDCTVKTTADTAGGRGAIEVIGTLVDKL